MVPWDVGTELWLMSAASQGRHPGPWPLADSFPPRQNVDWCPLWPHNFSPQFCFGRHQKFFLWLFTYCSQIVWKALWNLRTMLSWDWRTDEGEAERKIREEHGGCWGPCLGVYLPHFSKLDLCKYSGAMAKPSSLTVLCCLPPQAPSLSLVTRSPLFLAPPFFSPLTLPCKGMQLCKHQSTETAKERETKLKKKKRSTCWAVCVCLGGGGMGREEESKTGRWGPRRWSGFSHR